MFKKDWIVIGVYWDIDKDCKAKEMTIENATKQEAVATMYDYLCWSNDGLKIGFRDVVEVITIKKKINRRCS